MSTLNPVDELTTLNIGALFANDNSSSDNEKTSKNKKKNQKKRQRAKENKVLQLSHPSKASAITTSLKSESALSTPLSGSASSSTTIHPISSSSNTDHGQEKYAKFAHQRRLQFLAHAFTQAKQDSIAFKTALSNQTEENKQNMIEKLQAQNRDRIKKKASTRFSKIEKKLSKYISLETLRTNSAAMHLVEDSDRSSPDPFLLVFLKGYLANIKLPPEWSQKRRIYTNKFGNEKSDLVIPQYIQALNASHLIVKEDKTNRAQLAEMARAKIGQHNIDYQTWYDAFYTHMPPIRFDPLDNTQYEGKFEAEQCQHLSPLDPISSELQRALGMYSSSSNNSLHTISVLPPWIPMMQQYGPPPAYPNVYIPGVNAPLPPGATWSQDSYQRYSQNQYNSSTQWGQPPLIQQQDPHTGQIDLLSKWGGDVLGQTEFVKKMQTIFQQKYVELSKENISDSAASDTDYLAVLGTDSSSLAQKPSLTGIWYTMAKIAPPNDDLSLLLSDLTPLPKQTIETRFQPSLNALTKKTPKLFGAIDYIGFEDKLQKQINEQEKYETEKRAHERAQKFSADAHAQSQHQLHDDSTNSLTNQSAQTAKEVFMEQQRQSQMEKALGGNVRHIATGGPIDPSTLTGNMAASIYAPKAGQLFNEVNLEQETAAVALKRKQIPQGDQNDLEYDGEAVKKQRQ